jgi:hypothetical protein
MLNAEVPSLKPNPKQKEELEVLPTATGPLEWVLRIKMSSILINF